MAPLPKPLSEEDFGMYGALNLLKGALFWQVKPPVTAPTEVKTHAAP